MRGMTIVSICLGILLLITVGVASWETAVIMFFHDQRETLYEQVESLKNPPLFENDPDSITFYYEGNVIIDPTENGFQVIFEDMNKELSERH